MPPIDANRLPIGIYGRIINTLNNISNIANISNLGAENCYRFLWPSATLFTGQRQWTVLKKKY
ncbi:MAG: hypothetical protein FWD82_06680 [Defluviitaleaceae bacterium]|nr:hypothetical protein [Defluviitaleaceae bacterium]